MEEANPSISWRHRRYKVNLTKFNLGYSTAIWIKNNVKMVNVQ